MTNEYDDFEIDSSIEYKPLDLEVVRKNVPTYSSEKLCEMIVCDRYFGCYQDVGVICMEELASRRAAGDNFQFENYINDSYKKLPELKLTSINLREVLQQAIGRKINK
jgi:hypothetical protein